LTSWSQHGYGRVTAAAHRVFTVIVIIIIIISSIVSIAMAASPPLVVVVAAFVAAVRRPCRSRRPPGRGMGNEPGRQRY